MPRLKVAFEKNENGDFTFVNNSTYLVPLLQYTSEQGWESISQNKGWKSWNDIFSDDLSNRVKNVYQHTLGAGSYPLDFFKAEISEIFKEFKEKNVPDTIFYAALAILRVVFIYNLGHLFFCFYFKK